MAYFRCGRKALFYRGLSKGVIRTNVSLTTVCKQNINSFNYSVIARFQRKRGNLYQPRMGGMERTGDNNWC
jgi:hypothetical protein